MKKKIMIAIIMAVCLCGCTNNSGNEVSGDVVEESVSKEDIAEEPSVDEDVELNNSENSKKLEILDYINSRIDPLYETTMSDEEIDAKAEVVWREAEEKFGVTEMDIMTIMSDTDLLKSYYANKAKENEIKTYDATLEDNGYGTVAIATSKETLDEYIKALSNNDESLIGNLINSGKLGYEVNGVKVNILDMGMSVTKVKLLEGVNEGMSVYVINEQIITK